MNQWIIKMFAKSVSDIEAVLNRVALGVSSLAECQKHKYTPERRANSLLYQRTVRTVSLKNVKEKKKHAGYTHA